MYFKSYFIITNLVCPYIYLCVDLIYKLVLMHFKSSFQFLRELKGGKFTLNSLTVSWESKEKRFSGLNEN